MLQPGVLIVINRAAIGVPAGSMALIIKSDLPERWVGDSSAAREQIHTVQLLGSNRSRRYLGRDLEVISASR
jgi:hypothetical protein